MEEMIAESRLLVASACLAAAEYENARLAFNAALRLSPHGPRAQEATRGLQQAENGLKLERAATSIGPIVGATTVQKFCLAFVCSCVCSLTFARLD